MVDRRKIRELREREGLSMEELAEKTCTSRPMISYIESGIKKPSVELLKRIADFFGCTMDDLLEKEKAEVS